MLRTANIFYDILDVPVEWVFEHFLKLNQKLTGQNLLILSPLNSSDTKPSFGLYTNKDNVYKFKDFSTGMQGDHIALVQTIMNFKSRSDAITHILDSYTKWMLNNKGDYDTREKIIVTNYAVTEFVKRSWTVADEKFWTPYGIDSKLLEFFNVAPLESYKMQRQVGDQTQEIKIANRSCVYGYFRSDGTLYKIYQPLTKEMKFIKVRDYIQGTDQLTMQKKYLVICSSLKDMMSFTALGYRDAEVVAPHSENTLIPEHVMTAYKLKYKAITVLFDNDEAGRRAAQVYAEKYSIAEVNLPLEKDVSDAVKAHGIQTVLKELTPNLKLALKRNE